MTLATLRHEAEALLADQPSLLEETSRKATFGPLVRQTQAAKYVKLVNVATGQVLAVEHDSEDAKARLVLAEDKESKARQWIFEQDGNNYIYFYKEGNSYRFVNRQSGMVLHVSGNRTDEGAAIIQYDEKSLENHNQRCSWIGNEEGQEKAQRLKVKLSGLVLDTDDEGKVVQRQADDKAKSQLWQIIEIPENESP